MTFEGGKSFSLTNVATSKSLSTQCVELVIVKEITRTNGELIAS